MVDAADRTRGIGWLHLSDLEIARSGSMLELPEVRDLLERDLRRLHAVSGPWQLVAITGNVTADGDPAEFARAAQILAWLWRWLRTLGSEPALVLVPGPQDVDLSHRRPADPAAVATGDAGKPSEETAIGLESFVAFAAELKRQLGIAAIRTGSLPGDSSQTVEGDGLVVGVLGLNTWWLGHHSLGYIGRRQIAAACGARDLATWGARHDAVIVASEHAGNRLDVVSAQLLGEFHGPMLALSAARRADGSSGLPERRARQVEFPGLALGAFEHGQFGYRAGRIVNRGARLIARDWIRRLGSAAGAASLGPPDAVAVDGDDALTIDLGVAANEASDAGSPVELDLRIRHIAWSRDGARVAAIRGQGVLVVHDWAGVLRSECPAHYSAPCAIAWSPSGEWIATRSQHHVRIWDLDGALRAELELGCPSPAAIAWLGEDDLLLGGDDGLHYWASPSRAGGWTTWLGRGQARRILRFGRRVLALAVAPSRAIAAIGTDDGLRMVAVHPSRDPLGVPGRLDEAPTYALSWSPDARRFAAGGATGVVTVWDAHAQTKLAALEGLTDAVRSLSFSCDGRLLAATAIDGSHAVWSCRDWSPFTPRALRGVKGLHLIAFSPGADVVAFGGMAGMRLEALVEDDDLLVLRQFAAPPDPVVRTASAKVVLLGEGNVGKSCLAQRLTEDRYAELDSTHGMKFWTVPLEQLDPDAEIPPGERREVVFWDMGGQREYQLLHHAFLHDTLLALMVMEPRRGDAALSELAVWDRQLTPGRSAIPRMLVGSKLDDDRVPRDPALVSRALAQHGFTGYVETSAKTAVGIAELRRAIARAIDWSAVAVTTRPELFDRIRSDIAQRRAEQRVVLPYRELIDIVRQREGEAADLGAIGAVVEQLARQGLIADARLGDGSRTLILEVEQVERYATSLILAARDNPRGVPALEMASVGAPDMSFPRIAAGERLPRDQELVVLECVVDLLIRSGICFHSGRLLIFPALFRNTGGDAAAGPRGAVAIAYDFLGAADRIYSALVCWLALDARFGALRLFEHRAELAMPGGGTCGVHRVARPDAAGGRFEIYFDGEIDRVARQLFAGVIDDFLRGHGVELIEQLAVACRCGYGFAEDDVRDRLARGAGDVGCPRCDARAPLIRAAVDADLAAPGLAATLRAVRTERDLSQRRAAIEAVRALDSGAHPRPAGRAVHVLHLSDLHIPGDADLARLLQPLCSDLEDRVDGLGEHRPDLLIVSGDLTDRATPAEFAAARGFVSQLLERCQLTAERCIVVPGNHDLSWDAPAYHWRARRQVATADPDRCVVQGNGYLVRDDGGYAERFKNFSEHFFHPLFQRPYATAYEDQAQSVLFDDLGLQVLALNSAWQIDEHFPARSSIHLGALVRTIERADAALADARGAGRLAEDRDPLRLAVWHHPITGNEKIADDAFVDTLRRAGVRLCLHGHVHEDRADLIGYLHPRRLHVVGAGSFGAPARDRPESVPRLYNLIELDAARRAVRVHTRQLRRTGSAWEPWCVWPAATGNERRAFYEFDVGAQAR